MALPYAFSVGFEGSHRIEIHPYEASGPPRPITSPHPSETI
jgi:hypothetical protein